MTHASCWSYPDIASRRNLLIAEEKVHTAEARAQRAEAETSRLAALSKNSEALQAEVKGWQTQVMVRLRGPRFLRLLHM